MKVRFVITYDYDPTRSGRCRAKVRVGLPPDPDDARYIHPLLRDNDAEVAGRTLWSWWGTLDNTTGLRFSSDEVFAADWEKLEEEVKKFIDETITTLRNVKTRNERMMATMPTEKLFEYEI